MMAKQEHIKELFGKGVNLRNQQGMIPVVHLCYVAVDSPHQRKGYGKIILGRAMKSFYDVVMSTGILAMTLHCIDDETKVFYKKLGFRDYAMPLSKLKLWIPAPEVIQLIESDIIL